MIHDRQGLFAKLMAYSKLEAGSIVHKFSMELTWYDLHHLNEACETAEAVTAHSAWSHLALFKATAFASLVKIDTKRFDGGVCRMV